MKFYNTKVQNHRNINYILGLMPIALKIAFLKSLKVARLYTFRYAFLSASRFKRMPSGCVSGRIGFVPRINLLILRFPLLKPTFFIRLLLGVIQNPDFFQI